MTLANKSDIFMHFGWGIRGFGKNLADECDYISCQFFDAFSAIVNKNEAPLDPPMEGG